MGRNKIMSAPPSNTDRVMRARDNQVLSSSSMEMSPKITKNSARIKSKRTTEQAENVRKRFVQQPLDQDNEDAENEDVEMIQEKVKIERKRILKNDDSENSSSNESDNSSDSNPEDADDGNISDVMKNITSMFDEATKLEKLKSDEYFLAQGSHKPKTISKQSFTQLLDNFNLKEDEIKTIVDKEYESFCKNFHIQQFGDEEYKRVYQFLGQVLC